MKNNRLIIATIIFFFLITTAYYWEAKLGLFAFPALLLLVAAYFGLVIVLLRQLYWTIKERFKEKRRFVLIILLATVLGLTFFKPYGLIDFDKLEGNNILVAQREGAANCMTTFKLKENNKFIERTACFGISETKGNFKLINDTIYFENVELGRDENGFYKFAVIKKSPFEWNKDGYELFLYKSYNDTNEHFLTITENKLNEFGNQKPNR